MLFVSIGELQYRDHGTGAIAGQSQAALLAKKKSNICSTKDFSWYTATNMYNNDRLHSRQKSHF